jgi:hypothetical protein
MSPTGGYAASSLPNGTGGTPKTTFYRHDRSYVALLKIDGKMARRWRRTWVASPKASRSAPTGVISTWENFVDGNIDILRVDGDTHTKVAGLRVIRASGLNPRNHALGQLVDKEGRTRP